MDDLCLNGRAGLILFYDWLYKYINMCATRTLFIYAPEYWQKSSILTIELFGSSDIFRLG